MNLSESKTQNIYVVLRKSDEKIIVFESAHEAHFAGLDLLYGEGYSEKQEKTGSCMTGYQNTLRLDELKEKGRLILYGKAGDDDSVLITRKPILRDEKYQAYLREQKAMADDFERHTGFSGYEPDESLDSDPAPDGLRVNPDEEDEEWVDLSDEKEVGGWKIDDTVRINDIRYYGWDGVIVRFMEDGERALVRPINRNHDRCIWVAISDLD